jgi:DNA helicase-2/ATP-dependent DNA helicase PcrA
MAAKEPDSVPAPAYLDRLNDAQRRAATHGIAAGAPPGPPLLVIAGAGSGKTDTLAHRVAHLLLNGADPGRILLMTFSRRAAAEMTRRVATICRRVLGDRAEAIAAALAWAGTFHAVGARLIRDEAPRLGLDPAFTILDREDAADLMHLVRHQLGLSTTEKRFPMKGTCLAIYSRAVNSGAPLGAVLAATFPWCATWEKELAGLFAGYVEAKQAQNVLDYDDLLLYWAAALAEPAVAADIAARFDHVLVDEYQDTNGLQARILAGLKPDGHGVTVVGDDAQAIYSFRAATVRNILDFPNSFTPPAAVVTLERNYRSTRPVLEAANAVIALATERYAKELWTERDGGGKPRLVDVADEAAQARYVAARVLENRETGLALKQQAVLFRAGHHAGPLEVELTRRGIPFVKFGGLKFLDAAHVKDVLAVMRLAENPRDRVAGFRVLQLVPGIGPAAAGRVLDAMAASPDPVAALAGLAAPPRAGDGWPHLVALLGDLAAGPAWPADLERAVAWYEPHLERAYDDAPTRRADLGQLAQIATTSPSRRAFLTDLTLDPPGASSDESGVPSRDDDYLILSTIHSAKGQEWRAVFVLNVVDGCIPSDLGTGSRDDIEEERRLLYVAMTRARDALDLVVPQRFFVHGQAVNGQRHVLAARSRFLPPGLLARFEQAAWPPPNAETPRPARPDAARVDLAARMRAMWR